MRYSAPPYMYDVLPFPPAKEPWLHTAKWTYLEGLFRDVCRECGFYKSIYHSRSQDRKEQIPLRSIAEFKTALDAKSEAATLAAAE